MDFSLPKVATGILNKVVDKVADTVKDGVESVGEGLGKVGEGIEAIGDGAEKFIEAAGGAMGSGDVHIEAQMGSYGTSRGGSGTRTRSSLSL